jgi:hypothetical protein
MIEKHKAQCFADALTELCKLHGMMIWTAAAAMPIMATPIAETDAFYYSVDLPEIGNSVIIRRVLGKAA